MVKPSLAANIKGSSAAVAGGAGAGARFSSLMDGPYGQSIRENGPGMINKPPSMATANPAVSNGHSHHHHQSQPPPQKRRRSDTTCMGGANASLPPAPAQITKLARASPSLPSTPTPLPPPPFTHTDLRLATIRPPLVSIDNSAIESYLATASTEFEKSGQPRPFAGRKLYDPFVSPAQLLDGATLRTCVGGTVEVVIPTSLLVTPPSTPSSSSTIPLISSSCSVPPISPPPISLSFGIPSAYDGSPLPLTSNTTPISLPPHLYDLPSFKTRQVWGTDVYTDDSDLLGILVHSGWVRLARRERKLRAGEKGAGEEAIRRAREAIKEPRKQRKTISTVVNEVAQHDEEGEGGRVPKNLVVTLGIVPALVRYQGMERGGIRSRNWGNGHDGVSLRVENIQPLSVSSRASSATNGIESLTGSASRSQELSVEHGRRTLRTNSRLTSQQLSNDRQFAQHPYPHSFLPPPPSSHSSEASLAGGPVEDLPIYPRLSKPKRFKFSSGEDLSGTAEKEESELVVSDTFVLDLLTGRGKFVGVAEGEGGREGSDRMEIEV